MRKGESYPPNSLFRRLLLHWLRVLYLLLRVCSTVIFLSFFGHPSDFFGCASDLFGYPSDLFGCSSGHLRLFFGPCSVGFGRVRRNPKMARRRGEREAKKTTIPLPGASTTP